MKIILRTDLKGITIDSEPLEVFDYTSDIISLEWKRNELPLEEELGVSKLDKESQYPGVPDVKHAALRFKKTDATVKIKDGFARIYELFSIA